MKIEDKIDFLSKIEEPNWLEQDAIDNIKRQLVMTINEGCGAYLTMSFSLTPETIMADLERVNLLLLQLDPDADSIDERLKDMNGGDYE